MGRGDKGSGNPNSYKILDNNGTVGYNGSWIINTFSRTDKPSELQTSRSTGDANATVSVTFYGSQIQVLGAIPPGEGDLVANYTIDDGDPQTRGVPGISQDDPIYFQMLYASPVLSEGEHNFTAQVLQTGRGRNYTFQFFNVLTNDEDGGNKKGQDSQNMSKGCKKGDCKGQDNGSGRNDAAIVGGVLGSMIVLILACFFAYYIWTRRRLAQMKRTDERHLPPMAYYARPASEGTLNEKTTYTLEPVSVLDTDSKFTFAARRDVSDGSRRSWVPVDLPPSIPATVLMNDRPISSWSSYEGTSVIVQQPHPEISRFSPYTSAAALTPLSFTETSSQTPTPNRGTGPPSVDRIPASTSSSSQVFDNRRF